MKMKEKAEARFYSRYCWPFSVVANHCSDPISLKYDDNFVDRIKNDVYLREEDEFEFCNEHADIGHNRDSDLGQRSA